MSALAPLHSQAPLPTPLVELADSASGYLAASTSPATLKAYASDWRIFAAWCTSHGLPALPASVEAIILFLSQQADQGIAASTLTRRTAAIRFAHESQGHASPTSAKRVTATLKGIRHKNGAAQQPKAPATAERLAAMVKQCPDTLAGRRDRAILTLGFAGAFRRSELAALTVADLEEVPAGLKVTIRHSKTDQAGVGQTIAIYNGTQLQAVTALKAWLTAAGITDGYLFRPINKAGKVRETGLTDRSIANLVKHYAHLAGFEAATFSGHSLRSGFLTSAAENGASVFKMMEISRHRSVETLRGYVRMAELFQDHAGSHFL
jgi:site-specific recombinase XerD